MSLTKRLGRAAQLRATRPSPLEVIEVKRGGEGVGVDVSGPTAAVDLRGADRRPVPTAAPITPMPAAAPGAAGTSRFLLRRERLDRRDARLSEEHATRRRAIDAPLCPRCGTQSRIDIDDRTRGVLHASCDSCFYMWQAPAKPPASNA